MNDLLKTASKLIQADPENAPIWRTLAATHTLVRIANQCDEEGDYEGANMFDALIELDVPDHNERELIRKAQLEGMARELVQEPEQIASKLQPRMQLLNTVDELLDIFGSIEKIILGKSRRYILDDTDQRSIFSKHYLPLYQARAAEICDESNIQGALRNILTDYYRAQGMRAKERRERASSWSAGQN